MTVAGEHLRALRAAVGDDGVVEHAPVELDGASPSVTLRPADGDALSRGLAALGSCGLSARVRGGGHRSAVGNVPAPADAILSTQRLSGVVELDPGDGVCRALGGTPLSAVATALSDSGWELPADPPGEAATIGGVVAASAVGPRALGFGSPRDWVLGLDVVFASGERTRCGGRVVKNVTGYDLAKLYTGSFGTLGVIESAWLRLRPEPERCVCVRADFADLRGLCAAGLACSRQPAARAAAFVAGPDEQRLVVELAGDAANVEAGVRRLADEYGASPSPGALDAVRDRQARAPRSGLRFRVGVLPSKLPEAAEWLRASGASLVVHPGLCCLYAEFDFDEPTERAVEDAFRNVRRVASQSRAPYVCESAPLEARKGRDVFGGDADLAALFRSLKQRFDPGGVLNPGRFAGGV